LVTVLVNEPRSQVTTEDGTEIVLRDLKQTNKVSNGIHQRLKTKIQTYPL
jgi:hypothetical protein